MKRARHLRTVEMDILSCRAIFAFVPPAHAFRIILKARVIRRLRLYWKPIW